MSKLLRYVAVYLFIGMAYSYHLYEEASIALKAEEQRAIQRRNTAYSYMAKKRKEQPEHSSEELRANAKRVLIAVVDTSVVFVIIGWASLTTPSK